MFSSFVCLLRPHHWVKYLIIFAPPIFYPSYVPFLTWLDAILVFICFCFSSSTVYVINDLLDADRDKFDTRTSNRPIASGIISKQTGIIISIAFFIISCITTLVLVPQSIWIIIFYITINILYSIKLKFIAGLDVSVISIGFILRIMAGGIATSIEQSAWTIIIVGFAALSLALGKRLGQVNETNDKFVIKWNKNILLILLILSIIFTVISYILFSFDTDVISRHQNNYIWISIPPIILIFVRYFRLCQSGKYSGDPTLILLKDSLMQFFALIWVIIIFCLFVI